MDITSTDKIAGIRNPAIGDLGTTYGQDGAGFVSRLISTGVTIIFIVGSLYFVFMLLTGGVDWIRSGSDKAQLEAARAKISSAGVGLLVLFAAWAVFGLVQSIFGVSLLSFNIPTI